MYAEMEKQLSDQKNQSRTFILSFKSCRNQTWQGTVNWVEEKKTQPFRSALELIRLLDSTLLPDNNEEEHSTKHE